MAFQDGGAVEKKRPEVEVKPTAAALLKQLDTRYGLHFGLDLTKRITDDATRDRGDLKRNVLGRVLKILDHTNPELAQKIRKTERIEPLTSTGAQRTAYDKTKDKPRTGHGPTEQ